MKEYSNNNYQIFEHFLIKFKPAIGSVENQYYHNQLVKDQSQSKIDVRRNWLNFDAQFNAYHYSILDDMLPYDNRYQSRSWWTSQIFQQCKVFFRYHGYAYSLMSIYGSNNAHSQYPRAIPRTYGTVCQDEINKAPFNFTKSPLVQKLMRHNAPSLKKKEFKLMAAPNSTCLLYTSPSPRDQRGSRMPSSA